MNGTGVLCGSLFFNLVVQKKFSGDLFGCMGINIVLVMGESYLFSN
jgi:hypothetical protein